MADKTDIEWTDATWNPMTGCTKVSPGCAHCYAERVALRWGRDFLYRFHPKRLAEPAKLKEARKIFVCSMSDLFQALATEFAIDKVFAAMGAAPQHIYQVLTKRPDRALEWHKNRSPIPWPSNVWLGTSVENQKFARERIPILLSVPARVHFISAEPLLGPINIHPWIKRLDWVIAGGESGPKCRPMDPSWPRLLRDECRLAETAFFFKQWGGKTPKAQGRILDGKTWDQMPQTN